MFVVMSDSHTERKVIEEIKKEYQAEASAIFHCGDSELANSDSIWHGIHVVAGNCDDDGYPNEQILTVDNQRILLTHGHRQGLNTFGYGSLPDFAKEKKADVVLFGHIHRPIAEIVDHSLFLNPGSVSQPRGEWQIKMYACISVQEDAIHKTFKISYKNLQHQPIPELQFRLEILK